LIVPKSLVFEWPNCILQIGGVNCGCNSDPCSLRERQPTAGGAMP
jgi:hypothetical protein